MPGGGGGGGWTRIVTAGEGDVGDEGDDGEDRRGRLPRLDRGTVPFIVAECEVWVVSDVQSLWFPVEFEFGGMWVTVQLGLLQPVVVFVDDVDVCAWLLPVAGLDCELSSDSANPVKSSTGTV